MSKNILLIGPMPGGSNTTGVQQFNEYMAKTFREMGHNVTIGLPTGGIRALPIAARAEIATGCEVIALPGAVPDDLPDFLSPSPGLLRQASSQLQLDNIIVSGSNFAYGRILRAANCNTAVMTHGNHICPLKRWDGAELKRPGMKYLCINQQHYRDARIKGLEEAAEMFDIPVLSPQGEVLPAGNFAVAVGNLEHRKNYQGVARIAEALGRETRVFGRIIHENALTAVKQGKRTKHAGFVPHETLREETAKAEFIIHGAFVEGFSLALRAANGDGIPVITWDIPLYRDGLDPKRNILLDPARDIAEQLAEIDLAKYRKIAFRRELAKETHAKYGREAFRAQLEKILD